MPRIAAEETQPRGFPVGRPPDHLRRQPHGVAQTEPENVTIEAQRGVVVGGGKHDVAESLFAGHEFVPVGADHAAVLQRRTVKRLQCVARRVLEGDQFVDPAVLQLLDGPLLERDAGNRQVVADLLQLRGIGRLPARHRQSVVVAGEDDEPSRKVVHP